MAVLRARTRNALAASQFAGPGRTYPDEDAKHARDALSRASQFASPSVKAEVRAKVARDYPGMKIAGTKKAKGHKGRKKRARK